MESKLRLADTLPLIVVLGIVTAFDAMAIDMYLPAFGDIGRALGADAGTMQASLSVFLAGLAVGQFFYGPLSDRFGRRAPLLAGVVLFVAASAGIALAQDTASFLVGRALQGLGGAAGLVIPRAVVADLYGRRDAAKAFSLLMQVMMIGPIAAPPIGGLLLDFLGWRSIFAALAVIGLLTLVAILRTVPESLPAAARRRNGAAATLGTYGGLLRQRRFLAHTVANAFIMAGMFTYIGSSAFIFIDYFKLSPGTYSLIFAGIACGEILVAQLNILLLNRWNERQLLPVGLVLHGGAALLLVAAVLAGATGLPVIGALLLFCLLSLGLVFGNVTAMAMAAAPEDSGAASSLFGVIGYVFAGIVGAALGRVHDGTLLPPVLMMLVCAAGAVACWAAGARSGAARARPA